jgi:hypothetical protein
MVIAIELLDRVRPISGWLQYETERREFHGVIELISLLDAAWEAGGEPTGPAGGGSGLSAPSAR